MTTPDNGMEYVELVRDVTLRDGPTIPAGTVGYVIGEIEAHPVRYRVRWLGLDAPAVHTSADLRPSTESAWEAARAAKGAPYTPTAPLDVERPAPDVAAIDDARLRAIDRDGVRSIDDALAMGAAITDPSAGDVERLWRHAPDVIDCLAAEVRRFTAASADEFTARVHARHAEALRIARYTLPMEVLALIDDIPALLAHVRHLTAALADSDARVAAERERCAAVCMTRATEYTSLTARYIAAQLADAIAAPTGGA